MHANSFIHSRIRVRILDVSMHVTVGVGIFYGVITLKQGKDEDKKWTVQ